MDLIFLRLICFVVTIYYIIHTYVILYTIVYVFQNIFRISLTSALFWNKKFPTEQFKLEKPVHVCCIDFIVTVVILKYDLSCLVLTNNQ